MTPQRAFERKVDVTLDVEDGAIYELTADFKAPWDSCAVKATPRSASDEPRRP